MGLFCDVLEEKSAKRKKYSTGDQIKFKLNLNILK